MNIEKKQLRLYAITDRTWLGVRDLKDDVEKAIKGGATIVQLREKNIEYDTLVREAKEIKKVCEKYGVPLIINDNIDAALKSGADGVHLGQGDTPIKKAREILGDNMIIGATAKTVEQAKKAENEGADYLGSGAVFGSSTKLDAVNMDIETLAAITKNVNIPVVAIGGITADNVLLLKDSGIAGAAVVSGIFAEDDIEKASKILYERIGSII